MKFIHRYAQVARPLNKLISGENTSKKKKVAEWNSESQDTFLKLKALCSDTPLVAYSDYTKPFKLHTDASEVVLGAVLYQVQEMVLRE